jgi:hypothetical protein
MGDIVGYLFCDDGLTRQRVGLVGLTGSTIETLAVELTCLFYIS